MKVVRLGNKSQREHQQIITDEIITQLLGRPFIPPEEASEWLSKAASKATRGKAVRGLRRKDQWIRLVERLADQSLMGPPLSPNNATKACLALGRVRLDRFKELKETQCVPSIHLLRLAGELAKDLPIHDNEEWITSVMKTRAKWAPRHVATSLAMMKACCKEDLILSVDMKTWLSQETDEKLTFQEWKEVTDAWKVLDFPILELGSAPSSHDNNNFTTTTTMNKKNTMIHVSHFQKQVAQVLRMMQISFQEEVMEDGIDFLLSVNNKRIALECYGPTHYTWCGTRFEGRTQLKQYLIRLKYDGLITLNFDQWNGSHAELRKSIQNQLLLLLL